MLARLWQWSETVWIVCPPRRVAPVPLAGQVGWSPVRPIEYWARDLMFVAHAASDRGPLTIRRLAPSYGQKLSIVLRLLGCGRSKLVALLGPQHNWRSEEQMQGTK